MKLLGAGGHARVIREIIESLCIEFEGALGRSECIREAEGVTVPEIVNTPLVIAIGDNRRRMLVARNTPAEYPVLASPAAYVSPSATLGEGTVVMPGAVINAGADIGRHAIINTHASVDHDCIIGDYAHISPAATLCGGVTVGEGAWIGAGATIIPGVRIGEWATVGAGTTVLSDVPSGAKALGLWK